MPASLIHPSRFRSRFRPTPSSTCPPPTPLVEINPHNREPDDARKAIEPLAVSHFHELAPVELYDPSWNTAPLRCEAGRLGPNPHSRGAVLPVAFTLNSSDLDETDSDDQHPSLQYDPPDISLHQSYHRLSRFRTRPTNNNTNPLLRATLRDWRRSFKREDSLPQQPRKSTVWRRVAAAPFTVSQRVVPTARRAGMFSSPHSAKFTSANLRQMIENDYEGEVLLQKPAEMRAKLFIQANDAVMICNVVLTIESRNYCCRVLMRRTFADTFRISNEDFDCFSNNFSARFQQLRPQPPLR